MVPCLLNHLTMGTWNIEGIYVKINGDKICKLDDPTFQNIVKKFDLFCLQETHVPNEETIPSFNNFSIIPHCRKKSRNNRYFGGMLIYIRNSIKKGVKVCRKCDEDTFELILKKSFFGLSEDIRILYTYASPINSTYITNTRSTNILDKIQIDFLGDAHNSIILGDLNGRTKLEDDYVHDHFDKHSPIIEAVYEKDTSLLRKRSNRDTNQVDEQGRKIIDLCKASSLRVVNGRTPGDLNGDFTRYPRRNNDKPSTIDYALCSTNLIKDIHKFSVLPFTELSDHCCISLEVKIKTANMYIFDSTETGNEIPVHKSKYRFSYDKKRKSLYEENLSKNKNIETLNFTLRTRDISTGKIDKCVTDLNDIMIDAAIKTFPNKRPFLKKKNSRNKTKKWYNRECASKKRIFAKYTKQVSKTAFDREILHSATKLGLNTKKHVEKQRRPIVKK